MVTPAHLYHAITDAQGNLIQRCAVRVYEAGTTTLVADPFYSDPGLSDQLGNPYVSLNGIVDLYFDGPHRVRIGVTPPTTGAQEIIFDYVDATILGVAYYQTITQDGVEAPQRKFLDLDLSFTITDDATGDKTTLGVASTSVISETFTVANPPVADYSLTNPVISIVGVYLNGLSLVEAVDWTFDSVTDTVSVLTAAQQMADDTLDVRYTSPALPV